MSARAPKCQKLKMVGYTSMAKYKALTELAVKGLKEEETQSKMTVGVMKQVGKEVTATNGRKEFLLRSITHRMSR